MKKLHDFSTRLYNTLKTIGLSNEEFCKLVGRNESTVYRWLNKEPNEEISTPIIRRLEPLSTRYKVSIDWIVSGKGSMFYAGPNDVVDNQIKQELNGTSVEAGEVKYNKSGAYVFEKTFNEGNYRLSITCVCFV